MRDRWHRSGTATQGLSTETQAAHAPPPGHSDGTGRVRLEPLDRLAHALVEGVRWTITQFAAGLLDAEIEVQAEELQPPLRQPRGLRRTAPQGPPLHPARYDLRDPEGHGE